MRSQLFLSGALALGVGILFYVLALPAVFALSIPFLLGGAVMIIVSPFLRESEGPVSPPEGYRFCVFCSTPVRIGAERCDHCGGRQPSLQK